MNNRPSVMITGAARGIGLACAEAFLTAGWFVGVYDLDAEAVAAWATRAGSERAHAGALDVGDAEQWQRAVADHCAAAGGLDVLINNAGVLIDGAFEQQSPAAMRRLVEINVLGVMLGCRAAHAPLAARGGRVINLSSASAGFGQPYLACYSASKFAVRGLTEALHLEWADQGIQVCDIMPLFVRTAMVESMGERVPALRRLGAKLSAEDVAAVALRAATGRRLRLHYTVGLPGAVSRLIFKHAPDRLANRFNALISA